MVVLFPRKWRRVLRYLLIALLVWILVISLQGRYHYRRNLKETKFTIGTGSSSGEVTLQGYSSNGGESGDQGSSSDNKPSPTKPYNLSEEEKLFYRRSDRMVNAHNFSYLINPGNCTKGRAVAYPYLLIMVLANAPDVEKRTTIRNTWGRASVKNSWPLHNVSRKVQVYFLHAKSSNAAWESLLKEESTKYGDIIQEDFVESYRNLTLKTIMALKWASTFCSNASYVMKVDDDIFVNTPYIIDFLNKWNPSRHIVGLVSPKSHVRRKGKWKVTLEEFPFLYFPPYTPGAGYVMSVNVAKDLYQVSEYVRSIWLEDVYITGVLPKILGNVQHMGNDGFTDAIRKPPAMCDVLKGKALTGTRMSQAVIRKLWEDMNKASKWSC